MHITILAEYGLNEETICFLEQTGIETIKQLELQTEEMLLQIDYIGVGRAKSIKDSLIRYSAGTPQIDPERVNIEFRVRQMREEKQRLECEYEARMRMKLVYGVKLPKPKHILTTTPEVALRSV